MEECRQNGSKITCSLPSEREIVHGWLARRLAAEGMVLLKNEGILPLDHSVPIALLGSGAAKTVKGGIGSGDVNNRKSISIYQGLKEAGATLVSEGWLDAYDECYRAAREEWKAKVLEAAKLVENPFDAYAANPFVLPEGRKITEEDVRGAEVILYVISRISGEGKDRRRAEGDYDLSERENEDLIALNRRNIPIVLMINTGGPVELTDILEKAENIKAILYLSQPGQEGGRAAADVLFGNRPPGGRLTTTWAKRYEDYPGAAAYSYLNGNLETEEYNEGIFVGYRYFDRFGIQPLFPFGYGLSYTSFELTFTGLRVKETAGFQGKETCVEMDVAVKNVGARYVGREVVQIYAALPQTGEAKEYRRLVGFAKTGVLLPGETQKLTIRIEQKQFGSFSERMQAWVVEKGSYGLWMGNHLASLNLAAVLTVPEQVVIERTHAICSGQDAFSGQEDCLGQDNCFEQDNCSEQDRMEKRDCFSEYPWQNTTGMVQTKEFVPKPAKEYQKKDEQETRTKKYGTENKNADAALAEELPVEELIPLLYGNITQGASTLGSAGIRVPGSAGETSEALEETHGICSLIMADGPAGLRLRQSYETDRKSGRVYGAGVLGSLENGFLDPATHHEDAETHYQYCTAFPVGTVLAQTWDQELMNEFGEAVAKEMEEFHVNLWLAPGMNIHRNPLCGRNFEYYSEDPLLSGKMAAAVTAGVQSRKGCGVTIKHFACNNQEDNRMGVNVRVSEKALREIYLRGFEIAVKESAPAAVMSAYNRINGVYAANSRDLCTVLLREEWGFDGIVMSDWNTTCPEDGSVPWQCAAAGNDIIMPGSPKDDRSIRKAYEQGMLAEEDIRKCAGHIISVVKKLTQ